MSSEPDPAGGGASPPDGDVVVEIDSQADLSELRTAAATLKQRADGHGLLDDAIDSLPDQIEIASKSRLFGEGEVAVNVTLCIDLPVSADLPSSEDVEILDSAEGMPGTSADDGGGSDVVRVDAGDVPAPLPPRHHGPVVLSRSDTSGIRTTQRAYVLEWGGWGAPLGGTYHVDQDCGFLHRSDSDRDPQALPRDIDELEKDDDWSACGHCSPDEAQEENSDSDEDGPPPKGPSGTATPAIQQVKSDTEPDIQDDIDEGPAANGETPIPTLDVDAEPTADDTGRSLVRDLQAALGVTVDDRNYLTDAELEALRDHHPATTGDEDPARAVAGGYPVKRPRQPTKTEVARLVAAARDLTDAGADADDPDAEIEEDADEPEESVADAADASKRATRPELLADIRARLDLPDQRNDGKPTKADLREIYAALDCGTAEEAVLLGKDELAAAIRDALDLDGSGPKLLWADLVAIAEALPDAASADGDGDLPGGISRSALRAAVQSHETLQAVAEAVDASAGATRSALFAIDAAHEVSEGGSRSGAGPGGGSS